MTRLIEILLPHFAKKELDEELIWINGQGWTPWSRLPKEQRDYFNEADGFMERGMDVIYDDGLTPDSSKVQQIAESIDDEDMREQFLEGVERAYKDQVRLGRV